MGSFASFGTTKVIHIGMWWLHLLILYASSNFYTSATFKSRERSHSESKNSLCFKSIKHHQHLLDLYKKKIKNIFKTSKKLKKNIQKNILLFFVV